MNREQAVNVIKQIFDRCQQTEGKSIKLMPPKGDTALAHTFQIHVQMTLGSEVLQTCVRVIAKENNLAVRIQDDWLIVYKPYPRKPKF
ncbi:MAG: hypothetical protein ACQCN6_06420 [Candidatus Bathyarchaeia archaeon]|jgi:hypothetical protein